MLVALVLVLLAKLDDLFQDLDVEALALGFGEDPFFCSLSSCNSVSSCSMRSTNERMRSPAIPTGSDMVSPSLNRARTIQRKGKHSVKAKVWGRVWHARTHPATPVPRSGLPTTRFRDLLRRCPWPAQQPARLQAPRIGSDRRCRSPWARRSPPGSARGYRR